MLMRLLVSGLLAAGLAMAEAAAEGLEQTVKVTEQDCRWLVHHQPAPDVAYKPGVDVHGRSVTPADLDSNRRVKLPEVIAIPLHVPIDSLLKKGVTSPVGESEVGVGLVTVDRSTGEVLYEGQALVPAETERMVAACRRLLREK